MVYKKPAVTSRVYTLSIALSKYSLYPSRSQPCLLKPCPSVPKIINYHPNQSLWLLICANLCSSIMTPLFLHCISTPPLLTTGLALESYWSSTGLTLTPLLPFDNAPSVTALQRYSDSPIPQNTHKIGLFIYIIYNIYK